MKLPKSFKRMVANQPEWVVKKMIEFRQQRLAANRVKLQANRVKVPAPGAMTKPMLKELMEAHRWDIIGLYFDFQPKFLQMASSRPIFDWASCPEAMSAVLRKKDSKSPLISRRQLVTKTAGRRVLSFEQQGRACFYCGNQTEWEKWTIDHKTPIVRGGGNGSNCIGACSRCNHAKGSMTMEEFLETDYLPAERRTALGFNEEPVPYQYAKNQHARRLKSFSFSPEE